LAGLALQFPSPFSWRKNRGIGIERLETALLEDAIKASFHKLEDRDVKIQRELSNASQFGISEPDIRLPSRFVTGSGGHSVAVLGPG